MNYNAYKIDFPGDHKVNTTFKVRDLTPYFKDDKELHLRTNPCQPGKDVVIMKVD